MDGGEKSKASEARKESKTRSLLLKAAAAGALVGSLAAAALAPNASMDAKHLSSGRIVSALMDSAKEDRAVAASCKGEAEKAAGLRAQVASLLTDADKKFVAEAEEALARSPTGAALLKEAEKEGILVVPVAGMRAQTGMKAYSQPINDIIAVDPKVASFDELAPMLGHEITHALRSKTVDGYPKTQEDVLKLGRNGFREAIFTEESKAYAVEARISRELADRGFGSRLSRADDSAAGMGATPGEKHIAAVFDREVDTGADLDQAERAAEKAFREDGNLETLKIYKDLTGGQWKGSISDCGGITVAEADALAKNGRDDFEDRYVRRAPLETAASDPAVAAELGAMPSTLRSRFAPEKVEALGELLDAWSAKRSAAEPEKTVLANAGLRAARARLEAQDGVLLGAAETALRGDQAPSTLPGLVGKSGRLMALAMNLDPAAAKPKHQASIDLRRGPERE